MRRSTSSDSSGTNDNRTTLPPIRDLFGDELSRSPRLSQSVDPRYSPSASLARLNLRGTDEESHTPHDRYASAYDRRRPTHASQEFPPGYGGHSALGLSSIPQASSLTSRSPPLPTPFASSFPPDRPSSRNVHPSPGRLQPLADHSRSKSLSEAPKSQYPLPYPERQYYTSSPRAGSSLNQEVDWQARRTSASIAQPYSQSGTPYGRHPYGVPGGLTPESAGGPSGRGRSGSDTGFDRSASGKYECPYCGKGFNRPSSLKIHINSHTGEKPFMCPQEGCGRTFSVLSNMRRHARVHGQPQGSLKEGSSDDPDASDGEPYSPPMPLRPSLSSSSAGSSASSRAYPYPALSTQNMGLRRQSSSGGSVGGTRSLSASSDEDNVQTPQGPSRGYPGRD